MATPAPIVMIHGMWSRPGVWDNFAPYFRNLGHAVETPALRFHDRPESDLPAELGSLSLLDYAADLESAIRRSGEVPVLVGHSLGALIAQHLAARGLARALILLAPAALQRFAILRPASIRIFHRRFTRRRFWARPQRLGPQQAIFGLFNRLPPAEQEKQIAAMTYDSGRVLFELLLPIFDQRHAARIDAGSITCPVLIVAGADDRLMPAAGARRLAKLYGKRAQYIELADHAHWLPGEPGWEQIAATCAAWLAEARPR
jgi:pimeloyl-ACP methyl ester carboxylesterase